MEGAVRFKTDFTSVSIKPCPAERPSTCCVPIGLASHNATTNEDATGSDQKCGCEHRQVIVYNKDKKNLPLLSKNISALLANIIMSHF